MESSGRQDPCRVRALGVLLVRKAWQENKQGCSATIHPPSDEGKTPPRIGFHAKSTHFHASPRVLPRYAWCSILHFGKANCHPRKEQMPIASNTIPARFARLVASPEDFEAAVLTCVTAVGAHLVRRSALIHNGYEICSTLYSLIVAPPGTIATWYRWFRILEDPPPVTNSGIDRAEALVHLVRDRVI